MDKIKVLIVDDSALVRQFLNRVLSEDGEIEVTGTAIDPIFAMQKIMRNPPDVITLDVEMPRMDGLTFLKKLMESYPIPVVMVSSHTRRGCETTIRALELGAVDFIAKPEDISLKNLEQLKREIVEKVKTAARARLHDPSRRRSLEDELARTAALEQGTTLRSVTFSEPARHKLVAIGASTGGVMAVNSVIDHLKAAAYSIFVILHMPPGFTRSFAERLGSSGGWQSIEASPGLKVEPGYIYVAPGGCNMTVEKCGADYIINVYESKDIFKPNVNKTFFSVAKAYGQKAVGVILTGMGDDGAKGMLAMKQSGAATIAQNEETCMVFGMPKKAIEAGAVDYIVPLDQISDRLVQLL